MTAKTTSKCLRNAIETQKTASAAQRGRRGKRPRAEPPPIHKNKRADVVRCALNTCIHTAVVHTRPPGGRAHIPVARHPFTPSSGVGNEPPPLQRGHKIGTKFYSGMHVSFRRSLVGHTPPQKQAPREHTPRRGTPPRQPPSPSLLPPPPPPPSLAPPFHPFKPTGKCMAQSGSQP